MPVQDDYEVRLSQFQGPLDLLLFLVRRAEVDIADIPIAAITEQYFGFLRQLNKIDIEVAGEFLVVAATLVEIKSRTLAPRTQSGNEEAAPDSLRENADPRFELVQQLLAYQRYRTAAGLLDNLREESARRYGAGGHGGAQRAEPDDEAPAIDIGDAHVLDLLEAFEKIIQAVDLSRLGEHRVEFDDTPISLHQADLVDRLARSDRRRMELSSIFSGRTRNDMIGLFLALLELARQQQVAVRQDEADAPIEIELLQLAPEVTAPTPAAELTVELADQRVD